MEEVAVQEEFEADVSRFIMPTAFGREALADCFADADGAPHFYDGYRARFRTRERIESFGDDLSLIDVSPVGVSADGRHALIYVEQGCVGGCESGYFYLFERRDNSWHWAGWTMVWAN